MRFFNLSKREILFFVLLFVLKLIYLIKLPLPLSIDESYYWDWSRSLDWGYYSKPPMVAWMIKASTLFFGTSEWTVRLPALICSFLTLLLSYLLAKKELGDTAARWLLASLLFTPILVVYSIVMTIDPPLLFFWTAALCTSVEYIRRPGFNLAFLMGLFTGLGLLTKQTMIAFPVLLLGVLLIEKRLDVKSFALYLLVSALVYSPNVWWNFTHQEVMLKHTEEHFARIVLSFKSLASFFGENLGVYTPAGVLGLLFCGLIYATSYKRHPLDLRKISFFFGFLTFLGFLCLSYFIKLNTNWILPFVFTGFFLWVPCLLKTKLRKAFLKFNLLLSVFLCILLYLLPYTPNLFPVKLQGLLKKFQGWREVGEEVSCVYSGREPILVSNRYIASALAFYMPSHPRPWVFTREKSPTSQYSLWHNLSELKDKRVLWVGGGGNCPSFLRSTEKLRNFCVLRAGKKDCYVVCTGIANF